MKNIIINRKNRTITITKAFDKMASIYGSDEYNMLRDALNDNPGFRVVVKTTKQKKENFKGLTFKYMEKYIVAHDTTGAIMAEYEMMRGISKEAKEKLAEPMSYFEIKEWFLVTFPDIADFHRKREAVLENIKATKEIRAEEKAKAEEAKKEAERANRLAVIPKNNISNMAKNNALSA